jgi:hypothetical protein
MRMFAHCWRRMSKTSSLLSVLRSSLCIFCQLKHNAVTDDGHITAWRNNLQFKQGSHTWAWYSSCRQNWADNLSVWMNGWTPLGVWLRNPVFCSIRYNKPIKMKPFVKKSTHPSNHLYIYLQSIILSTLTI